MKKMCEFKMFLRDENEDDTDEIMDLINDGYEQVQDLSNWATFLKKTESLKDLENLGVIDMITAKDFQSFD